MAGDPIEGWFDILDGESPMGRINIAVQYVPKDALEEESHALEDGYFPPRDDCRLVMYQDADTPQLPQVLFLSVLCWISNIKGIYF